MNIKIKSKTLTDFLGRNSSIVTSVNMQIEYKVGNSTALGYYELLDPSNNIIYTGNEQVPVTGWGEDDNIIYNNFLEVLQLEKEEDAVVIE